MLECTLCYSITITWQCKSCEENFCDNCYDRHFLIGPHEVITTGLPTVWYEGDGPTWPRKLIGVHSYMNDNSDRDIWIPAIEPDSWFTELGDRR